MGKFGIDLNFNYGNLKLDKLFEDANKSGIVNLSSNQGFINSNFGVNIANNYDGIEGSNVETLDLSSSVENNSVNINPSNITSNSNVPSNQMNNSSNVNINTGKMNENFQNFSLSNSNGGTNSQNNGVISLNSSDPSGSFNTNEGKVFITTVDQAGNPINIEIGVDEYINDLKSFGFTEKDINRIINGEISPEKLVEEIQNDLNNNERRKLMMESSYLQAFELSFTNMDDFEKAINENTNKLQELMHSRRKVELNSREKTATLNVVRRLKLGESLEDILNTEIVGWKYVDEKGNVYYRYDDPYVMGNYENINYEALYYKDLYGNSDLFKELKSVLVEQTVDPLLGDKYIIHKWQETEEQLLFFDKMEEQYLTDPKYRELEEIDKQISELQEQQTNYQYLYEFINYEVDYYLKNIDPYIIKDDFFKNTYFNNSCVESLNSIKDRYSNYDFSAGNVFFIYITDKSEVVNIIACMINGEGSIDNEGYLSIGFSRYQLLASDNMLGDYVNWLPFINQSEIEVFNYIYNTEGEDAAYKYLEKISDELDKRWLENERKEDQEFASEHPFLASIGSVLLTPFEGINAAVYSLNSYFTGQKIRRTYVYSQGDIWRQQVSVDIAKNYGKGWAFVYDTGMSTADTGILILANGVTGGQAMPVLSTGLMGSRSYVSALNDALDRGLSDGSAVALAFSSAVVESAMESYSVGHLSKLQTRLDGNTLKLVSKVADSIANPKIAKIATKTTYIAANALSQGLCEGEEEFATEILKYIVDNLISGELSNHSIAINNYISLGYTEVEARQLADDDFASQLKIAFLGGFISGEVFGSFSSGKTTYNVSKNIANNMIKDFEGTQDQLFVRGIEINTLQQLIVEEQQKIEMKQKLKKLGNLIKSIFSQNTLNSVSVEISENVQNIINKLNGVYDLVVLDGTIEKLISKAKGEDGKIAGVELFRMLGYDVKPTIVSDSEFLNLSNNSEYGVIARIISGLNSKQYAERLRNGDMYVGGERAVIKGTGIYTGFGLSIDKISEKYATKVGTIEGGSVVEMVLSSDAKVIDYETIVIEQTEVLNKMSKEFNKYSSSIIDFDTLLSNLDKITNEVDLKKAKFITNFLVDVGYYAALQGYDAIVDKSVNYLTILNRGKLIVKQEVLSNEFETEVLITQNDNTGINIDEFLGKDFSKLSELEELEKIMNLEFNTNIDTNDLNVTAKTISIGKLLSLVTDVNYFINFELNNFDFSDFSKEEYNVGIVQLVHAIKQNSYDLGLNETENKRLDYLYNKALTTLPTNKIQYNDFLPNDFKLRLMFENSTIYSEKDLFILYDYYFEKFSAKKLYNNPTLIYSSEFKFYLSVLGNYISINSNQLSNSTVDFLKLLVTAKKDCENIIIENKIDIGEQEFKNLVSNIYNWHQNEREYVDFFSKVYDVDVSNMNYDQSLPDSLKLKIMIRDNIIYDRSLVINEFNNIILLKGVNDYNLIFNDIFMLYFRRISANLTTEEVNKHYFDYEMCDNILLNNLSKIIIENIDISEEQFRKLLNMIKIQGFEVENYINNYLKNHKEINLSGALDSVRYNDKLPIELKNKIKEQILSEYDSFLLEGSTSVYGSDQNAVAKYIKINCYNLDWLTDESDFINYLVTKRNYEQDTANKLLQQLNAIKLEPFTLNNATFGSILIEYIFDKCVRENRFDVLDIFNHSFGFDYKNNSEIVRLSNKLMNEGMSYVEALRTLCAIDSNGCCSYASIVNTILLSYKNNPQAFENDFGYPLYIYIDGKREFNSAELLLDMYIYINSNRYSDNYFKGNIFNYDQNGMLHINELNTENQVYLSGYRYQNTLAINSFLNSKKSDLRYCVEERIIYGENVTSSTMTSSTVENVEKLKEKIIDYLKRSANNSVGLGLYRTENFLFRFMYAGEKQVRVFETTETWNEGGAHAVCITGVLDNFFVVSSWGKRLLIPIEDFINNKFNVTFRNVEGIR